MCDRKTSAINGERGFDPKNCQVNIRAIGGAKYYSLQEQGSPYYNGPNGLSAAANSGRFLILKMFQDIACCSQLVRFIRQH